MIIKFISIFFQNSKRPQCIYHCVPLQNKIIKLHVQSNNDQYITLARQKEANFFPQTFIANVTGFTGIDCSSFLILWIAIDIIDMSAFLYTVRVKYAMYHSVYTKFQQKINKSSVKTVVFGRV